MKAKFIFEETRFNFDKNPTDRFRPRPGISMPPKENPRKRSQGLTDEEIEIVDKHQRKINQLKNAISDLEGELDDLSYQLENYQNEADVDEGEKEQFYAEVQKKYGFNALDILNSGMPSEEKIKEIDKLDPINDFGDREFRTLMSDYEYYHPDEVDQEEIEKIESKMKKINTQIKERENSIERLENKIYNLETY